MSRIARAAEHRVFSVDFTGEKHTVAVEGKECIFLLDKCFEVACHGDSDRRLFMETVAPGDPVVAADPADARIVTVFKRKSALKLNGIFLNLPMNAVGGKTCMQALDTAGIVHAEYAGISIFEWYDCTVENAVGIPDIAGENDRVSAVTPH